MKKWIIAVFVFIIILAICLYTIIPNVVGINRSLGVAANPEGFSRAVMEEKNWKKWWPSEIKNSQAALPGFSFRERTYTITEKKLNSLVINISDQNTSVESLLS